MTRNQAAEEALEVFCQGACAAHKHSGDETGIGFSDSAAFQDAQQTGGVQGSQPDVYWF